MGVVNKPFLVVAIVLGTIGLAAAQPASAPRIKVAVIPGIAVNLDAARVDALSQDLADALATELDIEATGGLEVRRQLPADGIPPDCVANPACITDVATRVGANQLLFVVMVDTGTGGAIQVDSTWVEPATGTSISRPAIDIASLTDAKSRFVSAARQLLPDAPVRPKPTLDTQGPTPTMTPEVPRHLTLPAKITGGVAVAGLGLGIALGLSTRSKFNACEANPAECSTSERDSIRTRGVVADIGWGLALTGAIATAVLYATSGTESRIVVTPSPEGGGTASLVRRF